MIPKLSDLEQRDARALAVYLFALDLGGVSGLLGIFSKKERRRLAAAYRFAADVLERMPRLISFAMTTEQVRKKTKTVTRRVGWLDLKPGEILQAVEKAQGLKSGEKVKRLCLIRVKKVTRVRLRHITKREVEREGFPGMSPEEFVRFFCEGHKCAPGDKVTRIEFEYL